jgi:hypothetical protein
MLKFMALTQINDCSGEETGLEKIRNLGVWGVRVLGRLAKWMLESSPSFSNSKVGKGGRRVR